MMTALESWGTLFFRYKATKMFAFLLKTTCYAFNILFIVCSKEYDIPPLVETFFQHDLEENALQRMPDEKDPKVINQVRAFCYRILLPNICAIVEEGVTNWNYEIYFHYLLWWEETHEKLNLMKYNMPNVKLNLIGNTFILKVPGVAEKRPSLLPGDTVILQPKLNLNVTYSCTITQISGNNVHLEECSPDPRLVNNHTSATNYMASFKLSRTSKIPLHNAIRKVFTTNQDCRVFPVRQGIIVAPSIFKFYNPEIISNSQQRKAVAKIVAGSSGKAPYIVFGPPGTGKTMTIVEAIIQIVANDPLNRVMVCTNSNLAADHIALNLLKYEKYFNSSHFILRSSAESRDRSTMPADLVRISNRKFCEIKNSRETFEVSAFRILATTLGHAAKYAFPRRELQKKLQISHLFIDEAGQATEPQCLIPITGLLTPTGQLVLAGDPQQLGPVCISKEASKRGLGRSLLERLLVEHANLYENDTSYMTMLVKNFRSDRDILKLPNQLFYKDELIAMAPPDPISKVSILGLPGGERATVFHAVYSREQKDTSSYFNEEELEMLKEYMTALLIVHMVEPEDIGIISPYNKQVYKIKEWLASVKRSNIEVGTVETFQGKEKRVILVSTVRTGGLGFLVDEKVHNIKAWLGRLKIEVGTVESFQGKEKRVILVSTVRTDGLGFLVDEKRFNVTLTRAKAKIIVVGNRSCLTADTMRNLFIEQCKELNCYFNITFHQLQQLLTKVTKKKGVTRSSPRTQFTPSHFNPF